MDNIRLSNLIHAMKQLTSSENKIPPSGEGNTRAPSLDLLLSRNLETFNKSLEVDPDLKNIAEVWNKVQAIDEQIHSSVRWTFTCYCLKLLHILVQCLKCPKIKAYQDTELGIRENEFEETESKGNVSKGRMNERDKPSEINLGVQDQKTVKTLLQFVICLGVCPCLQTGVGIPLRMRSGFSMFVEQNSESVYTTQYCLYTCLKVLLQCIEVTAISTLVLSQHLTDILAGLSQIIHSKQNENDQKDSVVPKEREKQSVQITGHRNKTPVPETESVTEEKHGKNESDKTKVGDTEIDRATEDDRETTKHNASSMTEQQEGSTKGCKETRKGKTDDSGILAIDVDYCDKALHDLYSRVYPPLLVKTLLFLQGGPKFKKPPSSKFPVLPPAPRWLRVIISQQLAKIAVRPKGVQYVLRGMLDGPGASAGTADWRRCDAVAKVIGCCPLQTLTLRDYYKAIGPQILELLHLEDKQLCKQYLRIACSTVTNMAVQNILLTREFVITPLIEALVTCQADRELPDKDVIVSESDISLCIEDCYKVFVCGSTENQKLILELQPIILTLFELLVFIKSGVSSLRKPCHELVVCFLRHSDTDVGLACLELMTFEESQQKDTFKFTRMHPDLNFQHGPDGGAQVTVTIGSKQEESDHSRIDCIVAVIKELRSTELPGAFFVHMLKELTHVIQTEVETVNQVEPRSGNQENLLEVDNFKTVDQFYRRLTLLNMLACLCEELGPDCIQNASHALQFVKATLERGVQVCRSTSDPITEVFESETLSMAMGLLTATLTGAYQLSEENQEFMKALLPLLQDISNNHPESSVQEMATDIRIAIATHGAVWSETMKTKSTEFTKVVNKISQESTCAVKELSKQSKPKIEVIKDKFTKTQLKDENSVTGSKSDTDYSSCSYPNTVKKDAESETLIGENTNETFELNKTDVVRDFNSTNRSIKTTKSSKEGDREVRVDDVEDIDGKSGLSQGEKIVKKQTVNIKGSDLKQNSTSNSELSQAYEELCDPMLPVRGHGLIRLTRMVQRRDPEILQRQQAILTIFLENLDHSDSYLYLAAVSGLAALCDLSPDIVLPKLCEQFSNFDTSGNTGGTKKKVELRMKIGEVLVKASRCLGDTIPKYRDMLIRTFLVGTKDCEAFVRASSLSNLGEICKLLRFSLGNCIHEVFECCSSLLRFDTDLEVRKAAGQAITLLLQGMNGDNFKVLENVVKDLYRSLKQSLLCEKEDGVKVHVTLALNELDDIMRKQLFPTQKLEKRIRVLDFD